MAMSESDKKKLPILISGICLSAGLVYYQFFYKVAQVHQPQMLIPVVEAKSLPMAEEVLEPTPRPILLGDVAPPPAITQETLEYTDAKGNPVKAILEPAPMALNTKRSVNLSSQDIELIQLMRDNLQLELENENERLKNEKNKLRNPTPSQTTTVTAGNPGQQVQSSSKGNGMAGFTDMGTVEPVTLSPTVPKRQVEEAFERISLSSITIDSNAKETISAWVKIDGTLIKATPNKVVGDFQFTEVTPDFLRIRYVPSGVTKKLGHSGFALN
ncbi:hypothetical protein [Vibrio sp.]|uniref:hypothetical protein n=1 Tax=Vibrio sp. TaxID=678 RepID=UPI003D0F0BD8